MRRRDLTHDEKKAAEAAFRGRQFDPNWSAAARSIYDGILDTMQATSSGPLLPEEESESFETAPSVGSTAHTATDLASHAAPKSTRSRDEAIEAGALIDVTPMAHDMGLKLPVGITKSLWEYGITASESLPEDQQEARVRDVLMALRLHLSATPALSPIISFPTLLSFPPEPIAQLFPLCAIVHQDLAAPRCFTLALPSEITAIIPPARGQGQ